jgi:hypothetical protein
MSRDYTPPLAMRESASPEVSEVEGGLYSTPSSGDACNGQGNHRTSTYVRTRTVKELRDRLLAEKLMATEFPEYSNDRGNAR